MFESTTFPEYYHGLNFFRLLILGERIVIIKVPVEILAEASHEER